MKKRVVQTIKTKGKFCDNACDFMGEIEFDGTNCKCRYTDTWLRPNRGRTDNNENYYYHHCIEAKRKKENK